MDSECNSVSKNSPIVHCENTWSETATCYTFQLARGKFQQQINKNSLFAGDKTHVYRGCEIIETAIVTNYSKWIIQKYNMVNVKKCETCEMNMCNSKPGNIIYYSKCMRRNKLFILCEYSEYLTERIKGYYYTMLYLVT